MAGWQVACLSGRSVGWSIGRLVSWLFDHDNPYRYFMTVFIPYFGVYAYLSIFLNYEYKVTNKNTWLTLELGDAKDDILNVKYHKIHMFNLSPSTVPPFQIR